MSESILTPHIREVVKSLEKIAFENCVIVLCAKDEISHASPSMTSILELIKDLENKAHQFQETIQQLDKAACNMEHEAEKMIS